MDNQVFYGQTFSKGQLTIPKKIRDRYFLGDNFSYKMTLKDGSILIEPQISDSQTSKKDLSSVLKKINKPIFTDKDYQNFIDGRKSWNKKIDKLGIK